MVLWTHFSWPRKYRIPDANLPLFSLLALAWLLALPTLARAATYYVAPTGSDSAPCTTAQPCRTIAQGIQRLRSGDTLVIRAGTYHETINGYTHPIPSGSSWTSATTFTGAPGEWPILKGCLSTGVTAPRYVIFQNFICDGTGDPDPTGAAVDTGMYIRLENLEIRHYTGNGLYVHTPTSHIEILRNKVHHNSHNFFDQGIYHAGSHSRIDGNEVYANGAFGIQVWKDGGGNDGNMVVNNRVHDNGGGGTCCAGIVVGFGHDMLVANNVVYNERGMGIQVTNNGHTRNTQVIHNTVYNAGVCLSLGPGAAQTRVENNILSACATGINDLGAASSLTHNLTTDPRFVNASAGDFALQAGSPAINAGVIVAGVSTDIVGQVRPQGGVPDVGAYEFAGGAAPAGPVTVPPPRHLRLLRLE